ncbi:MAG: alpha-amylase family glycosyl hydrolase [bacterium]
MTVPRLPIPQLTPRSLQKGEAGIIQRSFPFGQKNFFRLFHDQPLELVVSLNQRQSSPPQVILHTDIGAATAEDWQDIPFTATQGNEFKLSLSIPRCGLYRFRIKYSLDGGDQWFWDRVPHSYVMVDPPSIRTVRLYTLIPSASGTITDWKHLLPSITAMGFDAIHLLPITQMGYSDSPYAATNLFDVDTRYRDPSDPRSTLDQFEDFVQTCRTQGLRLCLDLVLNHICIDSQMVRSCPDWIVSDDTEPDGFKRAGCWHMQNWIRWEDLTLINYEHPNTFIRNDLCDYMKQYARFWSNYAACTGGMVRFDNLHSSNTDFVTELSASLHKDFPNLAILGEYFTDEGTLERTVPEWGINMLLANSWEYPFGPQLRHYLDYLHKVAGRLRHLCALTTHDTGVPAQLFGAESSAIPRYAICALYTLGQTGMVQGVEAGVKDRIAFIGPGRKLDLQPIPEIRDFITRINGLLATRNVFRQSGNVTFIDNGHEAILGAYRRDLTGKEPGVLLFSNLDIYHAQTVVANLSKCGLTFPLVVKDIFTGEPFSINDPTFPITMESCGVKIFEIN